MAQVTIGSFGIRLSGGQRARVALARAAYMEVGGTEWNGGTGRPWKAVEGRGRPWKAMMFYYGMIIVWKAMFGRPYHDYNMNK